MLDQSELANPTEYSIYEDLSQGAHLKTTNDPSDPYQRDVITSRGRKSQFKALVTLTSCVHGHLDSSVNNPVPATLVILHYELHCLSGRHKFDTAYTELEFSNEVRTSPPNEPHVIALAPFHQTATANERTTEVVRNSGSRLEGVGADVLGIGAHIYGNVGTAVEEMYEQRHFQLLQASREMSRYASAGPNIVWWNMRATQHPGEKSEGIPPVLRVAALVQRKDYAKFQAKFLLRLEAGVWYRAGASWKNFWGIGSDDPILFDPSRDPVGGEGIDKDNLGKLMTGTDLQTLGFFRNPVKLD
jgi:hypothetical protein